jgi:hypothetical protein
VPRAESEASSAASALPWSGLSSLVVRKNDSRGTPEALIPWPTSFSFL